MKFSCYTIIGKICEQLGGAFASRDKLANWQMGVSKWAVPLHHMIDWHIGRLADWQIGVSKWAVPLHHSKSYQNSHFRK